MAEKESGILKSLKHTHIIQYVDAFSYDTGFYMVMELAGDGDLSDSIKEQKPTGKPFSTVKIDDIQKLL